MQHSLIAVVVLLTPLGALHADKPRTKSGTPSDPLARILAPHLKPTVAILLDHYKAKRKYVNSDFPMTKDKFTKFKGEMKRELARTLGITDWTVRSPAGKTSPIADQFQDRLIKTISLHGVTVELHAVTLQPTGLVVPMAVCLPSGDKLRPVPGVCVFSGHTTQGLGSSETSGRRPACMCVAR